MPTHIVAIDSFDTPNVVPIKPKKNIPANPALVQFVNPGPMKKKSADRRNGRNYTELNGGIQEVHLLMLTAGPNPLLNVPQSTENWRRDTLPNNTAVSVADTIGDVRQNGHADRRKNENRQIRIIWHKRVGFVKRYANDVPSTQYTNGNIIKRLRIDVRDAYVSQNPGPAANPRYSSKKRYIWCPPGVQNSDVTDGPDPRAMTALGCTCRDMVMRGSLHARYGCKHIIAYNEAQRTGNLL